MEVEIKYYGISRARKGLVFWEQKIPVYLVIEARKELEIKLWSVSFFQFVTSFSSHTIEARGLKFGMHNPYTNASKVTNQIFDILPGSQDIKFKIM